MLNFGNKDFRNLQEQVLKNMDDIRYILEEEGVLNEFGIKVVGQVEAIIDLPSVSEYKAAHSDWGYGDAYAVGDEAPYELYILTRANGTHANDYWFEIGEFPVAGPQGPQGIQGATGATPSISVAANTTTLSAGQSASVSVVKSGTSAEPLLTFSFEIPQGAQGIQGIQGIQGPVGQQGPQGIQGAKGDPGYLYTIVGQVNDAQHLPLPTTVSRDAAFLVGTQEPYDVYVMIGEEAQELEWINLGEIATVIPNTFVLSDTYAESGTVDVDTLAAINNQTNMYFVRNGDVLLGYSSKIAGVAYFMALGFNTGNSKTQIGRVSLNLSTGAWTTNVIHVDDTTNMVTTNTTQTITGSKTFGSVIKAGFTDVSLVGLNGVAGFRAYKPGTTTQAGQMIVTNDGTVAGSYRAVVQAYNGTLNSYNTLRIGDTEGFKYYVNNDNIFTIGNDGSIYGSPTPRTGGIKLYPDYSHASEYNSIRLYPNFTYSQAQQQDVMGDGYMEIKTHEILFGLTHYTSANDEWDEVGSFKIAPSTENPGYVALRGDAGIEIEADYGGNGAYLKILYLPTSDPDESDAVFEASDGVLCMSGASYEPLPLSIVNGKLCVTYTTN